MDDELDFHSGQVASNYRSVHGTPATRRRVFTALSALGLTVAAAAVAVEHQFWWLMLTGRRATAQISDREEHIVGYISRRSIRNVPLIETEYHFTFTDAAGAEQRHSFLLIGSSEDFRIGQEVPVMYPRWGSGPAAPASWSFYVDHDPAWFTVTAVGTVCLLVALGCLLGRFRAGGKVNGS